MAKIDNNLSKIEHELEELILRQQTVEEQLDNLKKKIEELKKRKEDIECFTWPNCSAYMTDAMLKNGDTDLHEINMALL